MESVNTTKTNMVYVVGGGIMQDVGAFACACTSEGFHGHIYQQHCLGWLIAASGEKTASIIIRFKNLLALFSAPRKKLSNTCHFLTRCQEGKSLRATVKH